MASYTCFLDFLKLSHLVCISKKPLMLHTEEQHQITVLRAGRWVQKEELFHKTWWHTTHVTAYAKTGEYWNISMY